MLTDRMKILSVLLCLGLAACTAPPHGPAAKFKPTGHHASSDKAHNEPTPYDAAADARSDIAETLAAAKAENKKALLVFGANWCHDSRALAAHFEKPRFQTLISENYKLAYVDIGQKDRNIDLAQKFGVDDIVGSPTVFITNSNGQVLNLETAPTWRNAASRHEYAIWDYFNGYAQRVE